MKRFYQTAFFAVLSLLPQLALACDQCMGAKDSHIRPAVNGAIFFMLGLVAMMASCVGLFMRYLAKRAHLPPAPHEELVQLLSMPHGADHV